MHQDGKLQNPAWRNQQGTETLKPPIHSPRGLWKRHRRNEPITFSSPFKCVLNTETMCGAPGDIHIPIQASPTEEGIAPPPSRNAKNSQRIPLKGVNEQMNKEGDRGRWRRNIWVPKPPPGYTVHKATAAVASGPVVEDPAPNLLTGSQARDCKGPRFNHRPPRHITSKGLRASGVSEEDQQDIITARKTKRRTSLAVQWLRLHASTAGGTGWIPGWRTKIPHATRHSQIHK